MSVMLPAPETTPPITMAQVMAFAAASGDSNPVHLSEDAALAAGLAGPVLHGMIIAGRFETFLERMEGYEIVELQVRFVRPVPVGSALTIAARAIDVSGPQHHIRLLATMGGVLVSIAEARLEPLSDPTL
jgi:acyl dehydratase